MGTSQIIVSRRGRALRITLNRPDALNALNNPMLRAIEEALQDADDDGEAELIILGGAGHRGLCAGGDLQWLYDSRISDPAYAGRFWRREYRLNAMIASYPKPYVALMDGIVMGGGIGLSAHGSHRIVTDKSTLAMPETGIGLVPDVGATWLLANAQGELGTYLGLTGARMSGSDAIQAGFADSYVASNKLEALVAALSKRGAGMLDEVIGEFEEGVPRSPLADARAKLDDWFGFDSIEEIMARLNTTTDTMAQKARTEMKRKSPKALKLTLAALRRARAMTSLAEALQSEYRLVRRLYKDGEFIEGVRALLIDKDRVPKWSPPRLEDVTHELVTSYFEPLAPGEEAALAGLLNLPPYSKRREEN